MARFLTADAFEVPEKRLQHLPFRFERRGGNYLLSNMVGDFVVLTHDEFGRLVDLRVTPGDGLYEKAYAAHLITRRGQQAQHQLLALRLRSRMAFLRQMTLLHLFRRYSSLRTLMPVLPGIAPEYRSLALRHERG